MGSERRHWLFALATVALAWLAAFAVELIARFANLAYTGLVRDYYAAWIFAGIATTLLGMLWLGRSSYLAHGAAVLALLIALETTGAAIAFAMPAIKACQEYALPTWNPPAGCTGIARN